jgi:multiple sugar transport system permease protein
MAQQTPALPATSTAGTTRSDSRSGSSYRRSRRLNLVLTYLLLLVITLFFIGPLLWMLSTSLKPPSEYFTQDVRWIPRDPTLMHYELLLGRGEQGQVPVRSWFLNSAILATIQTVLVIAVSALAGYAYARLEFRGRKVLFALLLSTLFLPGIMFLIPNYVTIFRLDLLNSWAAVYLPALGGVFGVYFMRQFFLGLPVELEEAARIDGANVFQTFWQIMLPLARPALATLSIITFLGAWNEFLWPLLVLNDLTKQTLPVGLATLQGAYVSEYGRVMAGAVIAALPVLILYIALQKYIVKSVAMTGLKG